MEKIRQKFLGYCGKLINWGKENPDKLLHMLILAACVGGLKLLIPLWAAILIAVVIGISKEVIDDKWDNKDLIADAIGIIIGAL